MKRMSTMQRTEPETNLLEPSLFYAPPYERPVEDEFAWHLVKYLAPTCGLAYQHRIEMPGGQFWVDFVVEHGGRRIGFECGDLYTASDDQRLRDALLMGSGALDALYRFKAEDLMFRLHDCLHLAARLEPGLFSERGRINLDTLASPEARTAPLAHDLVELTVVYTPPADADEIDGEAFDWPAAPAGALHLRRLTQALPAGWIRDFDAAQAHFGITPEQIGERWARSA